MTVSVTTTVTSTLRSFETILNQAIPWTLQRYIVAIALTAAASGMRIGPPESLQTRDAWMTFSPAVMLAAIYWGVLAGLLVAALACGIVLYLWPLQVTSPYITGSIA